ncbi:MAG: hypothetical protein ACREPB_05840 [Arenimonas sp.]
MFKGLGILLAIYTLYAISQGEVFAKSGVWGNTISKVDSPNYFWAVITVYTLLSIALITVF